MKKLMIFVVLGLLFAATALCSYLKGKTDVWISEFKIYDANLNNVQHFGSNAPPELKEFMKGRYYYLANEIPKSWLGTPYDYGLVSTNMHLAIGKGDTGPKYEYQVFKERSAAFKNPETGQTNKAVPR